MADSRRPAVSHAVARRARLLTSGVPVRNKGSMATCRALLATTLLLLAPVTAVADGLVVFEDGRTMRVEGLEIDEGSVLLSLDDGGRIAVPADRIASWEPDASKPRAAARPVGSEPWRSAAGEFAEVIAGAAERHDLDPALLTAIAEVESAFDPSAVSPKGACGLLQLMPGTAERFGVEDVFDASQNVEGGARYLSWLLQRFDGRTELALAGYNAGERAVDEHRGIPPYQETRRYVTKVLEGAGRLARLAP